MAWPRAPFPPEHLQRATLIGLLTALLLVATARSALLRERNLRTAFRPSSAPRVAAPSKLSDARRARFIVARLAAHAGSDRGAARVVHAFVSMVGILGMFAAVTGALFAPWLAEGEEEDDGFQFWASCDDMGEKGCGREREERYRLLRLVEVP